MHLTFYSVNDQKASHMEPTEAERASLWLRSLRVV